MALEISQSLKMIQKQSLSMEMRQSLAILALNRIDLDNYLTKEIEKNPCLIKSESSHEAQSLFQLAGLFQKTNLTKNGNTNIQYDKNNPDLNIEYRSIPENLSLHQSLEAQLALIRLSLYELECVNILLQYIDENGYLLNSLKEIELEHKIYLDDLKFALEIIQCLDPAGVGASSLQESLILQYDRLDIKSPLAKDILKNDWEYFEKQNFIKIARAYKCTEEEVKEAFRFIRKYLDPKPMRQFNINISSAILADVYVFKRDGIWLCSLNEKGLPRLKIAKKYQIILDEIKKNKDEKNLKKYIGDHIRQANLIIRSLQERNKTILHISECILKKQSKFFDDGLNFLNPMSLKDVAKELGIHESTVSRSTAGKYMHTDIGIFELKYFFNTSIKSSEEFEIANETVKIWLSEFIKEENKEKPISDQEIANKLKSKNGVEISRRTVSKYREELGFLSSSKRKHKF